jgi:hypothetical protein
MYQYLFVDAPIMADQNILVAVLAPVPNDLNRSTPLAFGIFLFTTSRHGVLGKELLHQLGVT